MKIWEVSEYDNQLRLYWFETKAEAQRHVREYRKDVPNGNAEISVVKFDATRKGLVQALNHVISLTCFNEG